MSNQVASIFRITREKEKLERMLRDEKTGQRAMEAGMQRLVQLVNEKNSLVRRQMQLNILEQVTISKAQFVVSSLNHQSI